MRNKSERVRTQDDVRLLDRASRAWRQFISTIAASPAPGDQATTDVSNSGSLLAWFRNLALERILPNANRFISERSLLVWTLALAIGIAVAYAAIAFRFTISSIQVIWLGTTSENVYLAASQLHWIVILLAPAIGGLLVGLLLSRFMPTKRVHMVADVIEARALRGCKIDPKTGLGSAALSAISLGFGASGGREGPVVHLGATIASWLEDRFSLPHASRRTLLACGVAAAVSASFNAPIAGVLFAHEVILRHFAMRAFVPITISSVVGALIARAHLGNFPAFIIPEYAITSYWEFPAFALLGLTCALVAILFEFALISTERIGTNIQMPLWLRPVVGGLLVGAIAVFFPQVLGVGYGTTDAALTGKLALGLLLALIVAKTAATAITMASRFGGGIFSPSLYLGATTGAAFGLIATSVFPEIASSQGLYAILGMGAVASAILGAPISTLMIVFELTGGYDMTIALMLSLSISNGLTHALYGQSFFDWQLSSRGMMLHEGPHREIMRQLTVGTFMTPLKPDDKPPNELAEPPANWLTTTDTVEAALRAFNETGESELPVVDPNAVERQVGWVAHISALNAFNRALIDRHVEEHD